MKIKWFILFLLIPLFYNPALGQQSSPESKALGFMLMEEGDDFPSVLPVGTKLDKAGNIHSWYYYIEPDLDDDDERFMILYYSVVSPDGENYFYQLDKHPFSLTYYAVLQQQEFIEFPNGTVSNVFLKPSDFGTRLKLFSWNGELTTYSINYTSSLLFSGSIIGPVINLQGDYEFYFPAVNLSGNYLITLNIAANGKTHKIDYIDFPTFSVEENPQNFTTSIFDVAYANGSRYFLSGIRNTGNFDNLALIREEDGNFTREAYLTSVNVKVGSSISFLRNFLVDIIAPNLVATASGKLYSFLSNFGNDIKMLTQWKNGTAIDIFETLDPNPFFLSFFPTIYAVDNTIRMYFLGIQYAQDAISFSVDRFIYDEKDGSLQKYRFIENNLATDLFLFSADPRTENIVGIATRYTTSKPTLHEFGILNNTVGEVFLFADFNLPTVEPFFINLTLESDLISVEEQDPIAYLLPIVLILSAILGYITYHQWRKGRLAIPSELEEIEKSKSELINDKSFRKNFIHHMKISRIYLMTNKGRILRSILVLFVPALLLMSLFTGIASHQSSLMKTFESQNPLNDADDLSLSGSLESDFIWQNLWFSDEFQNKSLSDLDMIIASELSKNSMSSYGLQSLGLKMSSTTIFPLFSKVEVHFEINNEVIDFNFPDPHEIAVISNLWKEFMSEQLIRGRLPSAPNEVLLQDSWYIPRNRLSEDVPYGVIWDIGSEIPLYASELDLFLNTTIPGMEQNLTVVGVVKKVESLPFADIVTWAKRLNTTVAGLRILDNVPFYSFPEHISKFLNNFTRISIRPTSYVHVRYDVFNLNRNEIPEIIDNLQQMNNATLQVTGFTWIGDFDAERIASFLQEYYDASRDIQLEGFVLTIPVVALAILLTFEALGIGKTSSQQEIIRFKREGLRTERIVSLLVLERMLTSAFATLLSWIIVPFVTNWLLTFTDYFKLNATFTPDVDLTRTFEIAIITFLLLSFVGIFQSLKVLFSKEDWRYSKMMTGVQKDLAVVIVGLILVISSNYFTSILQNQLKEGSESNPSIELLIVSVQLISVVFATIGGIIVISKLLNRLFSLIGYIGWKSIRKKEGLIFKGFQMHVGLYGKLLVIFLISFFLIIPMLTIPLTIGNTYKEVAYYEFGTDITVENWDQVDPVSQSRILSMNEIASSSEFFYGILPFAGGIQINVFAINTTSFLDSIVMPSAYKDSYNLSTEAIANLKQGEFLTNFKFMERNSLEIGEKVPLQFEHNKRLYLLKLKGSYQEFPIFKTALNRLEEEFLSPLQIVITLETLEDFQNLYLRDATEASTFVADYMDTRNLLIRSKNYDEINHLSEEIKTLSGSRVYNVIAVSNNLKHPFFRTFEFLTHASIIVSALAPILSTIILSKILFERRKDELEVYYRNGTKVSFFIKQLTLELIVSTFLPSLLAIPLGYWWSVNYGTEIFGQKGSELNWDYNQITISIWITMSLIISLVIWMQQLKGSAIKYLKEVRL